MSILEETDGDGHALFQTTMQKLPSPTKKAVTSAPKPSIIQFSLSAPLAHTKPASMYNANQKYTHLNVTAKTTNQLVQQIQNKLHYHALKPGTSLLAKSPKIIQIGSPAGTKMISKLSNSQSLSAVSLAHKLPKVTTTYTQASNKHLLQPTKVKVKVVPTGKGDTVPNQSVVVVRKPMTPSSRNIGMGLPTTQSFSTKIKTSARLPTNNWEMIKSDSNYLNTVTSVKGSAMKSTHKNDTKILSNDLVLHDAIVANNETVCTENLNKSMDEQLVHFPIEAEETIICTEVSAGTDTISETSAGHYSTLLTGDEIVCTETVEVPATSVDLNASPLEAMFPEGIAQSTDSGIDLITGESKVTAVVDILPRELIDVKTEVEVDSEHTLESMNILGKTHKYYSWADV